MPNALPTAAAYRHAHEAQQRAAGGHVVTTRSLVRETVTRIHNRDYFEFRGANEDSVYGAALDRKNSLDIYRSPAIAYRYRESDEYVVMVRCFGLD
ncbi:hypothetical protein [Cupriavidus plantarum]|uniref:hypothetical protein n=1 Tax=Cupriavidus plantarum TaxID=942865 RepID=UPI00339D9211